MVDTVVATHQTYVEESGLEFTYHHDPYVYVYGNADMLRQATAVFFISNAVRYTPEGGSIRVSVTQGELMGTIVVEQIPVSASPTKRRRTSSHVSGVLMQVVRGNREALGTRPFSRKRDCRSPWRMGARRR